MDICHALERIIYLRQKLKAVRKLWMVVAKEKGIDFKKVIESAGVKYTPETNDASVQTLHDIVTKHAIKGNVIKLHNKSTQTRMHVHKKSVTSLKCECQQAVLHVDSFTQTELQSSDCGWDSTNITKDVKAVAENVLNQSGFVFDKKTGTYYDYHNNCHYIPDYKLYYYHQNKSYYYYDTESKSLKFHSKVEYVTGATGENNNTQCENQSLKKIKLSNSNDSIDKDNTVKTNSIEEEDNEDKEAAESWDTEETQDKEEIPDVLNKNIIIEAGPKPFVSDPEKHIAPCVRIVVQSTDVIGVNIGSLYIVTCNGGTLGREGAHEVIIPDRNVSKMHASFLYEHKKDGCDMYKIVDMGSRNGTFLDGIRLSETLTISKPFDLIHGSVIKVGSTILLCHIHTGFETCQDCEPSFTIKEVQPLTNQALGKIERESNHKLEVKRLKRKFGLGNNFGIRSVKLPEGYSDRSKSRRNSVGSSHWSEKTASTSSSESIATSNKGYQLLSKMGWKDGQNLGRGHVDGITTPVMATGNSGRNGLGSYSTERMTDYKLTPEEFRKALIWKKARQRYNKLDFPDSVLTHDSDPCDKERDHEDELK